MNPLKLPLLCLLILSNLLLTTPVAGQQKRRTAEKPAVKAPTPAPTPTPTPTFDTLLAADSFKIYAEVRGVGGLVRSSAVNDVLEPILKLGGPPKDFVDFVNWMKSHADQLTTSRMLIAAWPSLKDVPEFVAAIEFSSAEEAAKFETPLNSMLPTVFPPVTPPPSSPPSGEKAVMRPPAADQKPPAPVPGYALQRQGSLLLISSSPLQLKKLRPAGSKPLSEDPNFRVAYNRFASDPIFVFVDVNGIEKERQEREKQWAEQEKKYEEERRAREEKQKAEEEQEKTELEEAPETSSDVEMTEVVKGVEGPQTKSEPGQDPSQAAFTSAMLSAMTYALFSGPPVLPDAFAIGFSPESDSFDVRLLMIDAAGKTSDPVPLFSFVQLGAPIAPQSASVIPNDSELVMTMALDFQQLYTRLQAPPRVFVVANGSPADANIPPPAPPEAPLVELEKLLKIKVKDDLLPLLGSEVALSLPLNAYNPFAPPRPPGTTSAKDGAKDTKEDTPASFIAISLRDKEGMQRLMPKIVEGLAGKAAAGLAQTERREDTEIVSYAGMFAYAFIDNFIVLSSDPANVRHVVDSYLKGATLSADVQFRNYTRWQPHEVQGQVYISSSYAESYKTWANDPNARITEEARAFLARLTATPQPITYSLSNDGFGKLHELHVPKNVLLVSVAGLATMANPPATVTKEREAMSTMWTIANAERQYKEKNKSSYGSVEELMAAEFLPKEALNSVNYKFEVMVTADGYSITAVPVEYGKSGKLSLFLDQTGTTRGADHGGSPGSASDPPINP